MPRRLVPLSTQKWSYFSVTVYSGKLARLQATISNEDETNVPALTHFQLTHDHTERLFSGGGSLDLL